MEKLHVGQRATITCQGLTVTGTIESVFHDYAFGDRETILVGYYIELRRDDGHVHYWKSQLDGGSIIVHPDPETQEAGHDDDA